MAGPGILSLTKTQNSYSSMTKELVSIKEAGEFLDFKIWIKDDFIPCHKLVLALYSPYMRAMLMSNMVEATKQEVRLDHIGKDIMHIILEYMYNNTVNFRNDQLMDLIATSDYLQMTELKQMCVDEVLAILEPTNVIMWWKEANKMNLENIQSRCEEMMTVDFKQVGLSQQPDFLKLEFAALQDYLIQICADKVKSDDVLDAAMRWVSGEEDRVVHLEALMQDIHLDKCSAEGIRNVMKTHEAILDKQLIMYKFLSNTLSDISMAAVASSKQMIILGGEIHDEVNRVCWKVSQSGIEKLFDIPIDITFNSTICKLPEGFAITGGVDSKLCMMFVSAKRSWVRLQNMKIPRQCHGAIYVKGALLVIGGFLGHYNIGDLPIYSNSVHSLSLKDDHWRNGADLPLTVQFPKVSDITDDVYLFDGLKTNQLFKLEKGTDAWSEKAPLPTDSWCVGISMTSARGRLFLAGGISQICAWYNPDVDTWCLGKRQPLRMHNYGALVYHMDKLLLVGGNFGGEATDDVEEYDIEGDTWSLCSYKMPPKLYNHHALVLDMPSHY